VDDEKKILDAHVQFELSRWAGARLEESVQQEVAAAFTWLDEVRLADLLTAEQVDGWVQRAVVADPPSEEFAQTIDQCIGVVYDALLEQDVAVSDLLPQPVYDQIVGAIVEMRQIRPEIITQITTSTVYSQLVAHVLYHGIKTYLVTENAIARKIPGASSLFRMGQNAITSAAPGLEKSIDKKLIAFIGGNITETTKESSTFLNTLLDDAMMQTVADEVWAVNADRTLASMVVLLDSSSLDDAVVAGREIWLHLRQMPFFADLVSRVVHEVFRLHGDKPVGVLLALVGITPDLVAREVGAAAGPIVEQARRSGYLEERIRGRLDAFYSEYFAPPPVEKPRTARKRPAARRDT